MWLKIAMNKLKLNENFSSPLLEFFTARTRLQRKLTPQEELSDYLGDPVIEDLDECPINWWNSNKLKYPTLTSVALELLTIPVSSVASERTVSTLNRILSDRRTRLTNVNVNKLVVLISLPFESWESYIGVKFTTLSTSA